MEIQVLKGGLDSSNLNRYNFISGEVTNTRLMGVVAMHLEFEDTILKEVPHFHQFFYFDYEELGLETLRLLYSDDSDDIKRATKESFAGLGAEPIALTENEGLMFAKWMVDETLRKHQPIPEETKEIRFVLERGKNLLDDVNLWDSLNKKMCVNIKSDYGIVNYFLMRLFGLDFEAAALISTIPKEKLPEIFNVSHSTFLRNKIESVSQSVGEHRYYRTETLIELEKEERHCLIVSEIEVKDRKVIRAEKISMQKVSVYEAGLILSKEEYVSVFNLNTDLEETDYEEFIDSISKLTLGMTHNEHPAGTMFMNFKPNNDHAENKIFVLSDDIKNLFFLTMTGQIVIASFDVNGIIDGEARLMINGLIELLRPAGRYNFPTSIIYDFAESGIDDFNTFLAELE